MAQTKLTVKEKAFFIIAWIIAFGVNIKILFLSYCTDSDFCAVMAARLLRGDRLFVEMWEPHQTSAVIPALLEAVFLSITHSYEGIVLWLHFCGLLIFLAVSLSLILVLKKYLPLRTAIFMGLIFFIFRPKYYSMPDYTTLSGVFTALAWLFLSKYHLDKKKPLLFAGIFFACSAALAYPSHMLLFFVVIAFVYISGNRNLKDCLWVVLGYAVFFLAFLAYVLIGGHIGISDLLETVKTIFLADSHSQYRYSGWPYFRYTVYGVLFCLAMAAISYVVCRIIRKSFLKIYAYITLFSTIAAIVILSVISFKEQLYFEWIYFHFTVCASAIVIGIIRCVKIRMDKASLSIYLLGLALSLGSLLNTILLTDLTLSSVMGYSSLGIIVSLIPLTYESSEGTEDFRPLSIGSTYAMAIMIFFVCCFAEMYACADSNGAMSTIADMQNYIRKGPEKFLISKLTYCNRVKEGYDEWTANVTADDSVLIIKERSYEVIAYLYSEAKMANYSSTSAPSYDETQLKKFWEKFPDRTPTVIAVPCWQDEETRKCPEWLSQYIDTEFELSFSGTRWKFYRR